MGGKTYFNFNCVCMSEILNKMESAFASMANVVGLEYYGRDM